MSSRLHAGNLLLEESSINPLTTCPSYLEMKLVENTAMSGYHAVRSITEAFITRIDLYLDNETSRNLKYRLLSGISKLFKARALEIQMMIIFLVESRHLLSGSCATASESMYNMRRCPSASLTTETKISDRRMSLLLLVLGPYIKERFSVFYDRSIERQRVQLRAEREIRLSHRQLRDQSQCDIMPSTSLNSKKVGQLKSSLLSIFLTTFPFLQLSKDGISFLYQLAYLMGQSAYFSPSLHILGLIVRRVKIENLDQNNIVSSKKHQVEKNQMKNESGSRSNYFNPQSNFALNEDLKFIGVIIMKAVTIGVTSAAILGWFENFRKSYNQNIHRLVNDEGENSSLMDNDKVTRDSAIPAPKPPRLNHKLSIIDNLREIKSRGPRNSTVCPLCHRKRVNPVASPSGYVFCYRCILRHIKEHGEICPLTRTLCEKSDLVRIFEPMQTSV